MRIKTVISYLFNAFSPVSSSNVSSSNPRYSTPSIKNKSEIGNLSTTKDGIGTNKRLDALRESIKALEVEIEAAHRENEANRQVAVLKMDNLRRELETTKEIIVKNGGYDHDVKFVSYVKNRQVKDIRVNVEAVSEQTKSLMLKCLDSKSLTKVEQWIKSHKIDNCDTAKEGSAWDILWGDMDDEDEYISYTLKEMFEAIRAIFGKELGGEITEYTNLIDFHMETYNATDILAYVELLISIQVKILENNGKQTFTMNELISLRVGCALWKCQLHVDSDSYKHTAIEKQYSSESYVKLRKAIFAGLNSNKNIQPSQLQEKLVAIHETERIVGSMLNVRNSSKGNNAKIAGMRLGDAMDRGDFVKRHGLCFSFVKGSCTKGSSCRYKHDHALKLEALKLQDNGNDNGKGNRSENGKGNRSKPIPKSGDPGWIPTKVWDWKCNDTEKFKECKKCDKCAVLHKEWGRSGDWNGWNSTFFNNCPAHSTKDHKRIMAASNDSLGDDDLAIRNFIANAGK